VALRRIFSGLVSVTDPVKGSEDVGKSSNLHLKKIFLVGGADFL